MLWGTGIEIHWGCRTFVPKVEWGPGAVRTLWEGAMAATRTTVHPATRNCILCTFNWIKMCGPYHAGNGTADRNDDSQSAMSCPFHLMTSRTWRMPLSLQFWSSMQSNTVSDGRGDGKRAMSGFPRTRERMVVLGTGVFATHHETDF